MGDYISGHAGTSKNSFTVGDGKDGYKYLSVDNNLGYTAGLRFNDTSEAWEYSNDGVTWLVISSIAINPGIDGQVLIYDGYNRWSSDISLPLGDTRTIRVTQALNDQNGDGLIVSAGDAGSLALESSADGSDLELKSGARQGSIASGIDGDILFKIGNETAIGGFTRVSPSTNHYFRLNTSIYFGEDTTPTITQDINSSNIDGYTFTIKAQTAATDYKGADLYLEGGDASGTGYSGSIGVIPGENGSGRNGNIYLNGTPADTDCDNMENGMFIVNATTIPDGYAVDGGYLYSDDGALTWYSTSGTETTIAPAEPHCPRCGKDFAVQWKNGGDKLAICMWCLTNALDEAGILKEDYLI